MVLLERGDIDLYSVCDGSVWHLVETEGDLQGFVLQIHTGRQKQGFYTPSRPVDTNCKFSNPVSARNDGLFANK